MIKEPVSVYVNWAAYDELSDNIELTEDLAMRQLDELLRLRRLGVRFDYYLMDAFWYAPDGGYRAWRQPHWPHGPERWISRCLENDVRPGLWLSGNSLTKLNPVKEWEDSLTGDRKAMCFFAGGFWPDMLRMMDFWYQRGIRMFKYDFLLFDAVTPAMQRVLLPSEVWERNTDAFSAGLKNFRATHPEVVLLAYNGFEEPFYYRPSGRQHVLQSTTDLPFHKTVSLRWLDVFDSIYCGDPRPADVPAMNFWRSKDIFSDHMVRLYELNNIPLARVDNCGFMIGTTGTCYARGIAAWKGMLLLSLARGGWMNTYYGNLDLLDESKAVWFAKAQRLFYELQAHGKFATFGGIPGESLPYGFMARQHDDALYTVVNPGQTMAELELPDAAGGRILFRDAGFEPRLSRGRILVGPEQMALIGTGRYDHQDCELGIQEDIVIPVSIEPVQAEIRAEGEKIVTASVRPPRSGSLRIIMRQTEIWGGVKRSTSASKPPYHTMGKTLALSASQNGRALPVRINYDKAIWSGLSWAVGEVDCAGLEPSAPLIIRSSTTEPSAIRLRLDLYHVIYA